MNVRSPLNAIGAMMVLMQALAVGALAAVRSTPVLPYILVSLISLVTLGLAVFVSWLIWYLVVKLKQPMWLFDLRDVHPAVQALIVHPTGEGAVFEVKPEKSEPTAQPAGERQ